MSIEVILDVYPEAESDRFYFQLTRQFLNNSLTFSYLLLGCTIVRGGVKHLCKRYAYRLTVEECQTEIEAQGKMLLRPYQLGQGWDGQCEPCIMALFVHACNALGLNPVELYNRAYPQDDPDDRLQWGDIEADVAIAEWQGVHYPEWNQNALRGLLEALEEVNLHDLVVQLQAMLKEESKRHVLRSC